MPESITFPTYPFVKPINAKGYVARAHSMYDTIVVVVPEGIISIFQFSLHEILVDKLEVADDVAYLLSILPS